MNHERAELGAGRTVVLDLFIIEVETLPGKPKGKPEGQHTSRPHFPMSVQPVAHSSIALNQRPAVVARIGEDTTPLPQKQQARMEAVRDAKARITRRNSLRKQRQAMER